MEQVTYMTPPRPVRTRTLIAGLLDDASAWASGQVNSYVDTQKNDLQARAGQVAQSAAGNAGAAIGAAVGKKMIWIAGALVVAPVLAIVVWQLFKRYGKRGAH